VPVTFGGVVIRPGNWWVMLTRVYYLWFQLAGAGAGEHGTAKADPIHQQDVLTNLEG
jgi:hypothetical protein